MSECKLTCKDQMSHMLCLGLGLTVSHLPDKDAHAKQVMSDTVVGGLGSRPTHNCFQKILADGQRPS